MTKFKLEITDISFKMSWLDKKTGEWKDKTMGDKREVEALATTLVEGFGMLPLIVTPTRDGRKIELKNYMCEMRETYMSELPSIEMETVALPSVVRTLESMREGDG